MTKKKSVPQAFGFYSVLTDPVKGYDFMTELLVARGVSFVQLRMKDTPYDVIRETALRMRKITAGTDTRFIVNDDPQLAVEVGADGVHVGQSDMRYGDVRAIVGGEMIVGISTHNVRQARAACALRPDYIGVGPVFPTPTKKIADPAIGIEGMKEMLRVSDAAGVPAVCIGGIDLNNLPQVFDAGAKNFCMVRQLTKAYNPNVVLDEILKSKSKPKSLGN